MSEQKVNQDLNTGETSVGSLMDGVLDPGGITYKRKAEGRYSGGTEVNKGQNLGMGACIGTNQKGRGA